MANSAPPRIFLARISARPLRRIRANPRAEPTARGIFAKAYATWHSAGHIPRTRRARAPPIALGSASRARARDLVLVFFARARNARRLIVSATPHGRTTTMFLSASPARTPLAASRAFRSRVGVDRASRVRARLPSRALVSRARVEPRVLEDDAHARRRANAVSVASPRRHARGASSRALRRFRRRSIDDDGDVVPARAMTSRTRRPAPRTPVRLLTHYDAVVDCIVHEMDRTAAGDRVDFPSTSSNPANPPSASSPPCGAPPAEASASTVPWTVPSSPRSRDGAGDGDVGRKTRSARRGVPASSPAPRVVPTHAKYVVCHRATAVPTAVFGGVNIGDRFRDWRDFAIRCEGRAAVVRRALRQRTRRRRRRRRSSAPSRESRTRRRSARPASSGREAGGGGEAGGGHRHARDRVPGFFWKDTTPSGTTPGTTPGIPLVAASHGRSVRGTGTRPRTRRRARAVWVSSPTDPRGSTSSRGRRRGGARSRGRSTCTRAVASDARRSVRRVPRRRRVVDQAGSAVLADALDRGAAVTLVMPRRPNVYGMRIRRRSRSSRRGTARDGETETETREGRRRLRAFACATAARQSFLGAIVRGAGRGDGGLV